MSKKVFLILISIVFFSCKKETKYHDGKKPTKLKWSFRTDYEYVDHNSNDEYNDDYDDYDHDYDITSTPSGNHNTIFVGAKDGMLYALEKETGKIRWKFKTEGEITAQAKTYANNVYFGSDDSFFYCLDVRTGKLQWKLKTRGGIDTAAIFKDNIVFINSFYLYALDAHSGQIMWRCKTGQTPTDITMNEKTIFVKDDFSFLHAINIENGEKKWEYPKTKLGVNLNNYASPLANEKDVFFTLGEDKFISYNIKTKKKNWEFKPKKNKIDVPPILTEELIIIADYDTLYALNINNGKTKWSYNKFENFNIDNLTQINDNVIIVQTLSKYILALEIITGKVLWEFEVDDNRHKFNEKLNFSENLILLSSGDKLFVYE